MHVREEATLLGPAQLGVLASLAHELPVVYRTPRVAFMGSGDEIVDLDRKADILAGRKIASSNSYTLGGMIRRAGAEPIDLGIARDTTESLREHLGRFQESGADLLVTTAGVSVGEHDLVRDVLQELGGELKLWRVQMRPGAPLGFGSLFGKPWIGLPGNPVSTMVTFELFVRPAIRRLAGHALAFRRTVPVVVQDATSGRVLTHAWMNEESLTRTLETGQTWFWSRSRRELWHKGATSGNTQALIEGGSLVTAGSVELIALDNASVKYSTVNSWLPGSAWLSVVGSFSTPTASTRSTAFSRSALAHA